MAGNKLNMKKIRNAIPGSGGIISEIARRCGTTRQAVYNFLAKKPKLYEEIEVEKEMVLDVAEVGLINFIKGRTDKNGKVIIPQDLNAIKYYLSTQGKERGYTTKSEHEHSGEVAHVVSIEDFEDE